jgi:hypothetical protein
VFLPAQPTFTTFTLDYGTLRGMLITSADFSNQDFIAVVVSFLIGVPLLTGILKLEQDDKHE